MARKPEPTSVTPSRPPHPTIATIAAHVGVSRATVTHVLNGSATEMRIRPDTQRRVFEGARELGYRANTAARAIRTGRFGNIGLIQSLLGVYLPNALLHGLTQALTDKDLNLTLTEVSDAVIEEESFLPHTMRSLSVDGVLINRHTGAPPPYLERIHQLRIPAVFVNVKQEFDCVYPDDILGGRMATEYLLRLGHQRIAYVETDEPENRHYSKKDRRAGYEQAMREAGQAPWTYSLPKAWNNEPASYPDSRVETARLLLARKDRPTAVIAYELAEAMAIAHAACSLRLQIPGDLSLLQFHHCIDDRFYIPMQTVSNAMRQVGKSAVEMLLEKIESPEVALPARVVPVTMMDGATCMPPRP